MVQSGLWAVNIIYWLLFTFLAPYVVLWQNLLGIFGEWSNTTLIELVAALGFPDMGKLYEDAYIPGWKAQKKYKKDWSVDDIDPKNKALYLQAFKDADKQNRGYLTMEDFNTFIVNIDTQTPA